MTAAVIVAVLVIGLWVMFPTNPRGDR